VGGAVVALCVGQRGTKCVEVAGWIFIVLFLMFAALAYQWYRIDQIRTESPKQRTHRRRLKRYRPEADASVGDRLEDLAEVTAQYDRAEAWMDRGTVTGKLTFTAWIVRWWTSGPYLRRRLVLAGIAVVLLAVAVVAFLWWGSDSEPGRSASWTCSAQWNLMV
jgi:hypothetical protein